MKTNKIVILGVSASVAAHKAADITRQLCKQDVDVYPVMTPKTNGFIGRLTLEAISGKEVFKGFNTNAITYFKHLELAKEADLILIAPATANIIAHIANGYADSLIETLVLARDCPLLIAPAMNERMWLNDITQENVAKLKDSGVEFVGPVKGDLACGDEGIGRLEDINQIVERSIKIISGEK